MAFARAKRMFSASACSYLRSSVAKELEAHIDTTTESYTVSSHMSVNLSITEKPLAVRMGKGKGNVEYWVALIQPGKVLYEMDGVPEELAREAFGLAAAKLPIKTTFVTKTVM